jgi:hypothetical protein
MPLLARVYEPKFRSHEKNPEILKNDFLFFNFINILPFFFKRDEVVKGFFLFFLL